jgi:hypothetical protein
VESKAFLRLFIKRIEIHVEDTKIHYILLMSPDGKIREPLGVLPMVTPGGEGGTRTPTPFGT